MSVAFTVQNRKAKDTNWEISTFDYTQLRSSNRTHHLSPMKYPFHYCKCNGKFTQRESIALNLQMWQLLMIFESSRNHTSSWDATLSIASMIYTNNSKRSWRLTVKHIEQKLCRIHHQTEYDTHRNNSVAGRFCRSKYSHRHYTWEFREEAHYMHRLESLHTWWLRLPPWVRGYRPNTARRDGGLLVFAIKFWISTLNYSIGNIHEITRDLEYVPVIEIKKMLVTLRIQSGTT